MFGAWFSDGVAKTERCALREAA